MEGTPTRGVKRKRGGYCDDYSPETRCYIAKYAIENGNTKAARHFSDILKKDINVSTVRSIKSSCNKNNICKGNLWVPVFRNQPVAGFEDRQRRNSQ
jgi:hypothetical protein